VPRCATRLAALHPFPHDDAVVVVVVVIEPRELEEQPA
jgi:hypothetical protein